MSELNSLFINITKDQKYVLAFTSLWVCESFARLAGDTCRKGVTRRNSNVGLWWDQDCTKLLNNLLVVSSKMKYFLDSNMQMVNDFLMFTLLANSPQTSHSPEHSQK